MDGQRRVAAEGLKERTDVPIVLVVFNRPDHARRTLEAIREAAPSRLFVLADGPRPDQPDDVAKCAEVRALIDSVDWPCEVQRRFQVENIGLDASIESGLDWVFAQVDQAIILEDDCLPNQDFFRFCAGMLTRYRTDPGVWMVSGRAPSLPRAVFNAASYGFVAIGPIWGWATWRRAWQSHRPSHGPETPVTAMPSFATQLVTSGAQRYFADVKRDLQRTAFCWDSYWSLSVVAAGGLAVVPAANLIDNIGFDGKASHTRRALPGAALEAMDTPLAHPPAVELNHEIELYIEALLTQHVGRTARFVARLLGQGKLRHLVGGVVHRRRTSQARAALAQRAGRVQHSVGAQEL